MNDIYKQITPDTPPEQARQMVRDRFYSVKNKKALLKDKKIRRVADRVFQRLQIKQTDNNYSSVCRIVHNWGEGKVMAAIRRVEASPLPNQFKQFKWEVKRK